MNNKIYLIYIILTMLYFYVYFQRRITLLYKKVKISILKIIRNPYIVKDIALATFVNAMFNVLNYDNNDSLGKTLFYLVLNFFSLYVIIISVEKIEKRKD